MNEVMKKIIVWLFALLALPGWAQESTSAFRPDTTINKKLVLEDSQSVKWFCPSAHEWKVSYLNIRPYPFTLFVDGTGTHYLFAYFYEGNPKNQYSAFEIGYASDIPQITKLHPYTVADSLFATESGITLGMSEQELLRLKGKEHQRQEDNGTWLMYKLDEQSSFCRRYHMPGYVMKVRIADGKVAGVWLGFEYP